MTHLDAAQSATGIWPSRSSETGLPGRTKAELDVYRGIEGCRYREMTDAELRGRCLTLPEHSSAALAAFRQLFKDFALTLCMEGPGQEVLDICLSISDFLEKAEKAAVVQEAEKKKGVMKR